MQDRYRKGFWLSPTSAVRLSFWWEEDRISTGWIVRVRNRAALSAVTEGQACTVLSAREFINNEDPLLIYNADTSCRTDLEPTLPLLPPGVTGLLGVFHAEGERWSFARVDEDGRVVETAEKRRISPWATTGLYYFKSGSVFVRHAEHMIERLDRVNGESFIAPVYNYLIAASLDVRINVAEEVGVMETPEDLNRFVSERREPV